ncbi:MAG: hypothetical protein IKK24_00495, partial [Clostridia bacterium]|nr:hypothetical protein [Clostridia bacterium]
MTNKYKLSDLAKDFGKTAKEISALILDVTGAEKKSGASLGEEEIAIVFNELTKANSVKSFDSYFATGAEQRAAAAKKRQSDKEKKLADQMAILEQLKAAAAAAEGKAPAEEKKEE